jgi:hypothetical protein
MQSSREPGQKAGTIMIYGFISPGQIQLNRILITCKMLSRKQVIAKKITAGNWKMQIARRVKEVDWDKVRNDVTPFLPHPADLKAFRKEMLLEKLNSPTTG